ncbi:MAG: aminopeptidase P family protein [Clostridia bacterium]|nr:aminopeptidase P family protein [Clostridia bacterium]
MRQQLIDLRAQMEQKGIDYVLCVTDDYHASEYTGDYFKCRAFLTGFTGSAGTAVVSRDWAGLWTDGRYFLQAADQLRDSGFELMKMGEKDVPKVQDFLKNHVLEGQTLAFDARTITAKDFRTYQQMAGEKGFQLVTDVDLVGEIWKDRPSLSTEPVFELPLALTGESRQSKIARMRKAMEDKKADVLILSSLMDVCWLTNLRGADVACTPVVLSFLILTQSEVRLFIHRETLSDEIASQLEADGISIEPYDAIYSAVSALSKSSTVWISPAVLNARILTSLPDGVKLYEAPAPTEMGRAVKNETEVSNMRLAHIKDGTAVTRFMYWLKHEIGRVPMDELSVADKLESFRQEQENYLGQSFHPIMAYGPHGAIVHYGATKETCAKVEGRSFLLSDTGGHYLEGTTDITRTYAMGELTEKEKEYYTLVLKGHLQLGAAVFPKGTTGLHLDTLARLALWKAGLDFNHGTGHGVSYLMSVHEGPQSIRWRYTPGDTLAPLEAGMITSDEPGVYLTGEFGVRLEDLVVTVPAMKTDFGEFLKMEYLTMVPWDLDAIVPELLTEEERTWLNDYHRTVFETIGPRLPENEREWLQKATRAI